MEWDRRTTLVFPLRWAENLLPGQWGSYPASESSGCLSLTMGERAGFRLAHGCRSSSVQASWSLVTHHHFPLPCLSCGPTGYVRNLESRDGREWALRFGLEITSNGHHQLSLPCFTDPPKILGCIQVTSERNSSNVPSNVPEISDLSPGLEHSDAVL